MSNEIEKIFFRQIHFRESTAIRDRERSIQSVEAAQVLELIDKYFLITKLTYWFNFNQNQDNIFVRSLNFKMKLHVSSLNFRKIIWSDTKQRNGFTFTLIFNTLNKQISSKFKC